MVKYVVTTEVNVVIYDVIRVKCVIIWKKYAVTLEGLMWCSYVVINGRPWYRR